MTRFGFPEAAPETVGLSAAGLDAVKAAVQSRVDAGAIAGAVTLTLRRGQLVDCRAMGMQKLETGDAMTADTIFRIFSMTKPVTATAMMILRDEGRWHPDDPIARHLPEFAGARVLVGIDADGRPETSAADHSPTMAELMSHRAGFGYGLKLGEPVDDIERLYRASDFWEAPDLATFTVRLAKLPLAYQPGARWRYSLSMDLQGAIIERLSGQSLPDYYATRIFEPLGMPDTAFHVPPEKQSRLSGLYFRAGDAPLVPMANPLLADFTSPPTLALGGAGLNSTAGDYARYAQMLLNGGELDGKRIVSRAAIAEQTRNLLPEALLETRFVAGHQKFRPGFGYGYNGVVVYDPNAAGLPVGRGSYHWDGAAGTWFWIDPENELAFVGMIQLLSYTAPPLQEITQTLMSEALAPSG
ncbi:hypothetical protein sos41_40080 [Alphaproteobacteria bacterium SO-S41]|nr:hypothetical protein sos41_40080 [Alphaproteobacteria bacterium SO-S41]